MTALSDEDARVMIGVVAYLEAYFRSGGDLHALEALVVRLRRDLEPPDRDESSEFDSCAEALHDLGQRLRAIVGEA